MHSSSGHSRSAKMGAALICALPTELAYGHSEHNENFATDQHVLCRLGVKPTELTEAARPFMSAMHPGATKLMRRNELPLCATSGCEQMQQVAPLIYHLVGSHE